MKNSIKFLLFGLAALTLSSCLKDDNEYYNEANKVAKQFTKDSLLMSQYIIDNNIDTSGVKYGVLYQIIEPGEGEHNYTIDSEIRVSFSGKVVNGNSFAAKTDTTAFMSLRTLLPAWQIGLPLIQQGGRIRLIVPSYYGYGTYGKGIIPPNSVLDFDIELIEVK